MKIQIRLVLLMVAMATILVGTSGCVSAGVRHEEEKHVTDANNGCKVTDSGVYFHLFGEPHEQKNCSTPFYTPPVQPRTRTEIRRTRIILYPNPKDGVLCDRKWVEGKGWDYTPHTGPIEIVEPK